MARTFSIINLGCKVNRIESDTIAAKLIACGAIMQKSGGDVCVINTCTITAEADAKVRKAVRKAAIDVMTDVMTNVMTNSKAASKKSNIGRVLVTGCSAALNANTLQNLGDNIEVIANRTDATKRALELLGLKEQTAVRYGEGFKTRAGIKVQDGCNNSCSYCIVPAARGHAQSFSIHDILDEVETLLNAGARELVLSGINIGDYQSDGNNLVDLLKVILKHAASQLGTDSLFRIRLSSIEPQDVSDDLIALIATEKGRICRHLHLPLQSGSDNVLLKMNRRYTASYYMNIIAKLYQRIPSISISTDIIVGFPGESDLDFIQTLFACKKCAFSRIHAFRFSARPGTAAAEMPNKVPPETAVKRSLALRMLAAKLSAADATSRLKGTFSSA
ncbi:MAG: MiaB/RimO family radical SAM methylthiotransferase, partial [Coriobacteriales bacterium]|nr:MiaB/RimO family radical SAM methylthiotransferase [Coriobacteriales bacterium]